MDSNSESRGQQQFQEQKMQVDMEIEELRFLLVKMSQKRHDKRINIFISRENRQNSGRK